MKILSFFLLLTLMSFSVQSADSVRLNRDIDLAVSARTETETFALNVTEASGDADEESSPAEVFVPVSNGVADQQNYFLLKGINPAPDYLFDVSDSGHVIILPLYLNVASTAKYLYAAVKNSDNKYYTIKAFGSAISNVSNGTYNFELSPYDICQYISVGCSAFTNVATPNHEANYLVYFFLSPLASIADGQEITVTADDYKDGIYFKVYMSARTYSTLTLDITSVRQGDKRAFLKYSANLPILKPKSIRVFSRDPSLSYDTLGSQSGMTLFSKEYTYAQNGEVAVTDLVNSQVYNLSVVFVDQYNFATKLSPTEEARPQEIEELLKKQACFLLTAGFGEEHYVISYFRHFRDSVLSQSYLGNKFIKFYYELAPKYALKMYHSDLLRTLVRGLGYTLYFIFNYAFPMLCAILFATFLIYLYKKREKIKI